MNRREFLAGSAALALASAVPFSARAADPTLSGRLVFGVPGGAIGSKLAQGALDLLRPMGLSYQLQITDTRDSRDATESVKAAPPDGRTLLQAQSGSMVLFPAMYEHLGYDPIGDFEPLGVLGEYAYALVVGPAVPASVTDLNSYLKWARDNPALQDVGYSLYGSQGHLGCLILARNKDIALRPQGYRASRALFDDLRHQQLAAGIVVAGNFAVLGDKTLRPIAVTGRTRQRWWPQVGTFAEAGIDDLDHYGWYGWFAQRGLAPAARTALLGSLKQLQGAAAFQKLQDGLLLMNQPQGPEQISQRMAEEIPYFQKLVKSYGISQITS
ncbi:tripartite tricarboxylate transporter substrate-binding protein [Pseudomonas sp. NPDC007930]|uniref:tripartite tricarboxylate transporter substrate-binding protein n=1 Tax=Pseudomonas sp. NPDC007930 TaxID=3364417 RepID=UPI0036ED0CF2